MVYYGLCIVYNAFNKVGEIQLQDNSPTHQYGCERPRSESMRNVSVVTLSEIRDEHVLKRYHKCKFRLSKRKHDVPLPRLCSPNIDRGKNYAERVIPISVLSGVVPACETRIRLPRRKLDPHSPASKRDRLASLLHDGDDKAGTTLLL